ncbi:NAD(P)/FAD-dependent oxidoreductase [Thiovibrio sp. JS02]
MNPQKKVAIIGCGPAGLMAATHLAESGLGVTLFDAMPAAGRKFLVAGKGGLNLTNAEAMEPFLLRYGTESSRFARYLASFSPADLRAFLNRLGVETFVGSSGRIFPKEETAAAILKRWLKRLEHLGVRLCYGHRWQALDHNNQPLFSTESNRALLFPCDALLLALGGASWPQTGSDGGWIPILAERSITILPFQPANFGVEVEWSGHFRGNFAGQPLKNLLIRCKDKEVCGEALITKYGLEGGAIYLLGPVIREALEKEGTVILNLDLKRDLSRQRIREKLEKRKKKESLANFLRKGLGLAGPYYSLLRELCPAEALNDLDRLAQCITNLPVPVRRSRPLAEAISSAGGISFAEVDESLMLCKLPGIFVAGEMLNWEAPTGGYLLQGAFSTGFSAAEGVLRWLSARERP